MSVKVVLKNCRLHFLRLDKFRAFGDSTDPEARKYVSLVAAVTGDDAQRLTSALQEVCVEEFGDSAPAQFYAMKEGAKLCVKRGVLFPEHPELAPFLCLSAARTESKGFPEFRGPSMAAVTQAQFCAMTKNGATGTVVVNIWQQNNTWGKRINAELLGVQFGVQTEIWAGAEETVSDSDFDRYEEPKASAFDTAAPAPAGGFAI